jgi:hypothetical protein
MNQFKSFETGSILLADGAPAPSSLHLSGDALLGGWGLIANARSTVDKDMTDAGWTLFFVAGGIKVTVFGFDERKTVPAALKRLARIVRDLKCNSFEIAQVTHSLFMGISSVTLSGHARHLQKGSLLFGE